MEQPQLAQILATIPPQNQSLLNKKITDDSHLADIARSLTSWRSACDKLGITEQEEEAIEADNPRLESQKVALLRRWRSKYSSNATYRMLAECLYNAGKPGSVEVICKVVGSIPQPAAMQTSLAYSNTQTNPIPQQQPVQPSTWMARAGYAPPQTSQYPQHTNQYPAGVTYQSAYPQPPYAGYHPQPSQYRPQQETQLTPNDLGALKRLIQRPVAAYWIALADQLGMTSLVPTIQSTPGNIGAGPPGCLRDLLNRWLNTGHPTVETLCKALREDDEIIGGSKVADELEETFRGQGGGVPRTQLPQQHFTASEVNQGYAPVHHYQSYQSTASQHPPPPGSNMSTSVPPSWSIASQHPPPPGGNMYTGVPPSQYTDPGPQAPGPQALGLSSQAHPESSRPGVIRRGDRPTLPYLNKFPVKHGKPINIAVQIGINYRTFGTFLLEDDNGAVVSVIERTMNFDPERINGDILMRWIRGQGKKPITWGTLITCLRDLELETLASDIEEALQ